MKSLSGQLGRLQAGKSFLIFQGSTCANPIDEGELATYLVDSIKYPSRRNQIIHLGGPDRPLSKIEQGEVSSKRFSTDLEKRNNGEDEFFLVSFLVNVPLLVRCSSERLPRNQSTQFHRFGYSMHLLICYSGWLIYFRMSNWRMLRNLARLANITLWLTW
jgi:hypothetical protein